MRPVLRYLYIFIYFLSEESLSRKVSKIYNKKQINLKLELYF